MKKAKEAALRALELDPTLSEAHTSLGLVLLLGEWDIEGSLSEFDRAVELNRNDSRALSYRALALAAALRIDEAIASVDGALELDPLSMQLGFRRALLEDRKGNPDAARQRLQQLLEHHPGNSGLLRVLGKIECRTGLHDRGLDNLERALEEDPDDVACLSSLARCYGLAGRRDEALALTRQLEAQSAEGAASPLAVASVYTGLGDSEAALLWLEKAYAERAPLLLMAAQDPDFASLRDEPRFAELIHRVGIPVDLSRPARPRP